MESVTRSYTYTKKGSKWVLSFTELDPCIVSFNLMRHLIAKKLHQCKYIKSIKEIPLYNGYRKIVVYFNINTKTEYIIPDEVSNYLFDMRNYIPFE